MFLLLHSSDKYVYIFLIDIYFWVLINCVIAKIYSFINRSFKIIYIFLLSKQNKIREVYGNETISKIQILKEQMLNLAKIHYKTLY